MLNLFFHITKFTCPNKLLVPEYVFLNHNLGVVTVIFFPYVIDILMKDMALYIRYMAYKYAFQRKICKNFSFLIKINND